MIVRDIGVYADQTRSDFTILGLSAPIVEELRYAVLGPRRIEAPFVKLVLNVVPLGWASAGHVMNVEGIAQACFSMDESKATADLPAAKTELIRCIREGITLAETALKWDGSLLKTRCDEILARDGLEFRTGIRGLKKRHRKSGREFDVEYRINTTESEVTLLVTEAEGEPQRVRVTHASPAKTLTFWFPMHSAVIKGDQYIIRSARGETLAIIDVNTLAVDLRYY